MCTIAKLIYRHFGIKPKDAPLIEATQKEDLLPQKRNEGLQSAFPKFSRNKTPRVSLLKDKVDL